MQSGSTNLFVNGEERELSFLKHLSFPLPLSDRIGRKGVLDMNMILISMGNKVKVFLISARITVAVKGGSSVQAEELAPNSMAEVMVLRKTLSVCCDV